MTLKQQIDEAVSLAVEADRERWLTIRRSPEAEHREALANHLANSTTVSVEEALEILARAPADPAPSVRKLPWMQ
jgi:hypothetical protein